MEVKLSASEPPDLGKLSPWATELARTFVALSSDIALVIDEGGVIRTVAQGQTDPMATSAHGWVGRSWIDTVSTETRSKVEKLLQEASSHGIARRREVNHPLHSGTSVPIAYTAIRLGEHGPVLAVGRDMRAIAAIQERFIETQQDLERGYWRARQAESRYRLLFQVATDAVMVIDPETLLILDANPAAGTLFSSAGEQLVGKHATVGFAHASRRAVNELMATALSSGQSGEIRACLLGSVSVTHVVATSFRAGGAMRLLVRVRAADSSFASGLDSFRATLAADSTARTAKAGGEEAAAITDSNGRILIANPAFLRLVRAAGEDAATGRPLIDWLAAIETPVDELVSQVRRQGVVGSFAATLLPTSGSGPGEQVAVSAALLTEGDQECIGFTIRRVPSPAEEALPAPALAFALAQLAQRLGELPLSRLVHEAATLAEAHFIQLALERSAGDVDAAASLLGVDRARLVRPTPAAAQPHDLATDASTTE
jgi:transcriptional regulator PpsR